MKKSIRIACLLAMAVFAASGVFAAGSKNAKKKNKAKAAPNHAEYIDWQGMAAGKEMPKWYQDVLSQEPESVIREDFGISDDYRIFTVISYGTNRKALMTLTDSFGIQSTVAAAFRQNVMRCADQETTVAGQGEEEQSSSIAKITEMITVNIDLIGLERAGSYWSQYRIVDKKGNEIKPAQFAYCVVMKMKNSDFEKQLEASMKSVDEATDQASDIRKLATATIARLRHPDMVSGSVTVDMSVSNKTSGSISDFSNPAVASGEPEVDFYGY